MAVSTTSYFNHGIMGLPQVAADVDLFAADSNPKFATGTLFTRSDGAEFVYSHFGAAIPTGGIIVAQDVSESASAHVATNSVGRVYASASTTAIAGETIRPGTLGSHFVEIKAGGATADQFAGGYFQTVQGGGGYFEYRIKGNTASGAKTSGAQKTYYLELYEPLQQSLDGTTSMRIIGSKYANLESCSAASDQILAGATTCSHAAATWGWVRKLRGVVALRALGTATSFAIGSSVGIATGGLVTGLPTAALTGPRTILGYACDLGFIGTGLLPVDCNL